jgi:hypothetical protein
MEGAAEISLEYETVKSASHPRSSGCGAGDDK